MGFPFLRIIMYNCFLFSEFGSLHPIEGISLYRAMGMFMCNHELVESCAYSYGFSHEIDACREVVEDRDRNSDFSAFFSTEVSTLFADLDPSVNLAGKTVMEDLVSSLLGILLSSGSNHPYMEQCVKCG
ncbi:hypothetical protein AYI68_g7528 [Smittium mucronatum]|uniref:Uncharacterized protein n=1 Tax=Smittium mucronatum TaxID=133383 RepID=A0A1R0GNF8_9FUNG|nr:hypothetical protein AYI68_g7528 [Smittium mucronatum]